jgi:hypothetical protein
MPFFDIGVEGRFRANGVEAPTGEAARELVMAELKTRFNALCKFERARFQPSAEKSAPLPPVENS